MFLLICNRNAQERVCAILDALLSRLLKASTADVLGPLLQPIIFALAGCMDSDFRGVLPHDDPHSDAVVNLIQKLVIGVRNLLASSA